MREFRAMARPHLSFFGADHWLGEICCVAQNESREMAENVALQIRFRSKGFSMLQTNCVVQFVLHPFPKAQMFTPVNGNTQKTPLPL